MTRCLALAAALLLAVPPADAQEISGWSDAPYAGRIALSAGFPDDPYVMDVTPGGAQANPIDGVGCVGYIGMAPDVVLDYDAGSFDLSFSATAETDINLVVRDPAGRYHCDDDGGDGFDPFLTIEGPRSGEYRIWVGVYGSADEYVDGRLGISEVGEAVVSGEGATDEGGETFENPFGSYASGEGATGTVDGWDLDPYFGILALAAGFSDDPRTVEVNAGGTQPNPLSGVGCAGSIGTAPDVVVDYEAGGYDLTFSAASDTDLTLVVRTPGGAYYCDDDGGDGTNPRIDVEAPASGAYQVWVGTFLSDEMGAAAVFGVSEVGATAE